MSHVRMSHVTHMHESCHSYEWVMSHVRMSHVTWRMSHVTRKNESCQTYESVMSHEQIKLVPRQRVCACVCVCVSVWMSNALRAHATRVSRTYVSSWCIWKITHFKKSIFFKITYLKKLHPLFYKNFLDLFFVITKEICDICEFYK